MHTSIEHMIQGLQEGTLQKTDLADGTGVIVDIEGRRVLSLNASGLLLLQELVDGKAADTLPAFLVDRFQLDAAQAQEDADTFLSALANALQQD